MQEGVQPEGGDSTGGVSHLAARRGLDNLGRVAGFLALAALAGMLHARALAAVAVVLVVLITGFFLPWFILRRVRICWRYPTRRAQAGKPVAVRLFVDSRLPWSALGLVVRGGWAERRFLSDPLTVGLPRVPAGDPHEHAITVVPERRGVYPRSPAIVQTGFPFGFWQSRPIESEGQLLVWPEIVALPLPAGDAGQGRGVLARSQRSGHQGEFFGARPYRRGESLRQVHWKQSARHDELIVWESRGAAARAVVLLVETATEVHTRHAGGDSLEKTLSVGASLASGLVGKGLAVTLAFGRALVFPLGNRQQLDSALDAMARFEPGQAADQEKLIEQLPRSAQREPVWVITTLAGWDRSGRPAARRTPILIDDRANASGDASPPDALTIPLADVGHSRLRDAWKEVSRALEALV